MKEMNPIDTTKARSVYEGMIDALFGNRPLDDLPGLIDPSFLGYGTAAHESFNSREEVLNMARMQTEQLRGQKFTLTRKPVSEKILASGALVLIVEEFAMHMKANDHHLHLRLTTLLEKSDENWKVVHFHGSTPDADIAEAEAFPMEGLKRKNEELEAKIRERTRDLEIEASLERTRAQSMQMQHSDELSAVSKAFHEQLLLLGIDSEFSFVWLPNEAENTHVFWSTWADGPMDSKHFHSRTAVYPMDKTEPYTAACFADWKSGVAVHEHFVPPKDIVLFFAAWTELLEGAERLRAEHFREGIYYTEAFMKYGCFGIDIRRPLTDEEKTILHRFAREFERAYTRFLDLQKAEAQAREAQIEAALERVRSRTMAMHSSDELKDVAFELRKQMGSLEISELETCAIHLYEGAENYFTSWSASKSISKESGYVLSEIHFPRKGVSSLEEIIDLYHKKAMDYVVTNDHKSLTAFLEVLKERAPETYSIVLETFQSEIESKIKTFWVVADFSGGSLVISTTTMPSEETRALLRRFANVFNLSYQRFSDLKQAEAQAREARVEAALERVRSRSMAMHKSEELAEVATVLYNELLKLEVSEFSVASIVVFDEPNNQQIVWGGQTESEALEMSIMPLLGDQVLQDIYDKWLSGEALFSVKVSGVALENHKDFVFPRAERTQLVDRFLKNMPDPTFFHCAVFSMGYLELVADRELAEESASLLLRFAKVFDQSYTRFLDLQKAEAQAREARIEMALERVRAGMMAMHKSDELRLVIKTIFEQLQELDFGADASAVIIYDENYAAEHWFSGYSYQTYPKSYTIPYIEKFAYNTDLVDAWKKGLTFQAFPMEGTEKTDYGHWLLENTDFKDLPEEFTIHAITPDRLVLNDAFNKYGMLEVLGPEELAPENAEILNRFSKVFEQTYTRFLDLQKAEAQAREAQVEAALERVRSRTMGMQTSDELREVVLVINEQLLRFDFGSNACNIIILDKTTGEATYWVSGFTKDIYPVSYHVPYLDHPYYEALLNPWKRGDRYIVYEYSGQDKKDFEKISFAVTGFKDVPKEARKVMESLPNVVLSTAYFSNGALQVIGPEALSEAKAIILQRFAKVFDQTYTRFLDLLKAEAQAREARVEAALERVRSRTIGMQQSAELQDAANELFRQVEILGMPVFGCGFNIWDPDRKAATAWMAGKDRLQPPFKTNSSKDIFARIHKAAKKGDRLFVEEQGGQALQDHYAYMATIPTFREIVAEMEKKGLATPDFQIMHCAFFSQGYLMFISFEPVPDFHEIFKRFAGVFEQTYTRFLDLKKAEAQAREAQIETALERVRSRSMAMQASEELQEVIQVIFEQLTQLNINAEHAGIVVDYQPGQDWHFWVADKQDIPSKISVPYLDLPWDRQFAEAREKGTDFFTTLFNFEEKNSFYQKLLPHIDGVTQQARDFYFNCPGLAASTVLQDDIGLYIENFSGIPYSDDENNILKRFGKVFQQTYTRFLDLKKAEAQAREAQVELSLERIRAQVTAMTESADLLDIVVTLRSEFGKLGHEAHYFWHMRWQPEGYEKAMTSGDGTRIGMVMKLPRHMHGDIPVIAEWEKSDRPTVVFTMDVEATIAYVDKMVALGDFQQVDPNAPSHDDIRHIGGLTFVMARTTHGEIGYSLPGIVPDPPAEDLDTLVRFAGVFDLAYRRFEDLKASEQQIRQARIETALERVRARALAMQEPEELKEVARVLRHEMGLLGVEELETSSIYINDAETSRAECWYAIKDIREQQKVMVTDHFTLDLQDTWVGREMLRFCESAAEQVSIVMKGGQRREWIDYCESRSEPFRGYYGEVIPDRTYHLYKFSHGSIGVATDGDLSEESWRLLRRAASVFSLAYSRFRDLTQARLDLQRLKEEKKRAEDALAELQLTQKQLVHAEKMASLGELTAGIAHEIQNPLNFVNNFSEVSAELLSEMYEEIAKGDLEEALAIAEDIKQNLEKITHHGKRADGIVKGMLQHSRSSDGKKQPTDLNKLADEYLRLAYHGLRAKDKSFNSNMETYFDPAVGLVEVVPQDIGRVLLNLLTNAFHAVGERKLKEPGNYNPTVWMRTRKTGRGIEIEVQDNGGGIPDAIRDKIFQPFFTTKPTGEGTGLGLSMSYDIVTKGHGGQLKVASKVQEGTEFIVILPV